MENPTIQIVVNNVKRIVSLKTIEYNFAISEHYEITACDVGEGGQRGFESMEEYIELLKGGNFTGEFNILWGTSYYIANFGNDFDGMQKVIQFCRENNIAVETHERVHRP